MNVTSYLKRFYFEVSLMLSFSLIKLIMKFRGSTMYRGLDSMVIGFITTYSISAYQH